MTVDLIKVKRGGMKMNEDFFWLKVSESSLKKTWDNEFDER